MTRAGGSRKTGLNRSMRAQGLYELVQLLKYKSALLGGKVALVPPNDTTQRCSACHHKPEERLRLADSPLCISWVVQMPAEKITRRVRKDMCEHCKEAIDRDLSTSINALGKGAELLRAAGGLLSWKNVEYAESLVLLKQSTRLICNSKSCA